MADRPAHADLGASLLAKLKNKAKAANVNYQQILRLFFQEEFLRRLSKSVSCRCSCWLVVNLSSLPLDIQAIYRDIKGKREGAERDCHAGRVRAMPPAVN